MQLSRAAIRSAAGRALAQTRLMRLGLRKTGVIIAFHRVNDRTAGDDLTRGTRDYEEFLRFFRTYFDVVPLTEVLRRLEADASIEGLLAITHDDGYLDNFDHAAPILEKVGLPATFFVSTGFIGTDTVPFWDRDLPERHAWMNWNQVREMSDRGFEIGAHTCLHVDLGTVSADQARAELIASRADLEGELGQEKTLFAYPFGGMQNMTPENLELVREAGYRCCLSCCGGMVRDGSDPFYLPRIPMSPWYQNPDQLAFDLGLARA